jgi:AcrR family transcriptional regulator
MTTQHTRSRTAPRRTQAERRALSRQRVIDAAIAVISDRGYSGTTLAAIGEAAGYSRGLAHHHFGSKVELMRAVVAEMERRFQQNVLRPPPAGQTGLDAVLSFVDDYLAYVAASGPDRMRALFVLMFESLAGAPELRPIIAEMSATRRVFIRLLIEQGIADGTIRPEIDAEAQAVVISGLVRGATHQWILEPAGVDLSAVSDETRAMLRCRLARDAGPVATP